MKKNKTKIVDIGTTVETATEKADYPKTTPSLDHLNVHYSRGIREKLQECLTAYPQKSSKLIQYANLGNTKLTLDKINEILKNDFTE